MTFLLILGYKTYHAWFWQPTADETIMDHGFSPNIFMVMAENSSGRVYMGPRCPSKGLPECGGHSHGLCLLSSAHMISYFETPYMYPYIWWISWWNLRWFILIKWYGHMVD